MGDTIDKGLKNGFAGVAGIGASLLDVTGSQGRAKARRNALNTINGGIGDEFNLTNPDGTLKSNLRQAGQDFFGRDQLRSLSDFTQTSPIAQRLLDQQAFENTNQRNQLNARNQSNLRNNISTLSSRGGIDAGARLRLASQAQTQNLLGAQKLAGNAMAQRNQTLTQDADRSLSVLQNLANLDRSDQRADLSTRLQEAQLGRQTEAARINATAQLQNSQSGGTSFICTKLREKGLMSNKDSSLMLRFMMKSLKHKSRFLYWYVSNMKPVVDKMEMSIDAWAGLKRMSVNAVLTTELTQGRKPAQDEYIRICSEIAEHHGLRVPHDVKSESTLKNAFYFLALFTKKQTYKFLYTLYKPKTKRSLKWLSHS